MEQIKAFLEKLQGDATLITRVKELRNNRAAIDELVTLAAENGFYFTGDEWRKFIHTEQSCGKQELNEDELEVVSGGANDLHCQFQADNLPVSPRHMNGLYLYARHCVHYRNVFACNSWTCGCFGSECCIEGLHYASKDGGSEHVPFLVED